MSKDRVEIFSDAVFAIILTLLVLELRPPNIADHSSLSQYVAAMAPLVPKIVSFVVTFITVCIHWVSHHYLFRHIRRTPVGFIWLNNLFLLWLCFMPFPTALLGDHPTDQFPVLLYGINQLLAALTFFGYRSYASKKKLFILHHKSDSEDTLGPRHSVPAIVIYTLSIVLSFVNVYLALACFIFIPLLYFVPNLMHSK